MRQQRGMVLIMVLLIFSVVAILATAMIERQSIDIERSTTLFAQQQARGFAYAAEAAVRYGLYMDWEENNQLDHAAEEWTTDRTFPLDPGVAYIHISDLQGRFNLNSMLPNAGTAIVQEARFRNLLNELGLDTAFAARWRAWLDKNSQADEEYSNHEPPYRAAYQACRHTSEIMLITDMDMASYRALEPYIACLPASAQLNVNTAEAVVIAALDSGLSLADAQQIIAARGEEGFTTVDAFWGLSQLQQFTQPTNTNKDSDGNATPAWQKNDFSVASEYFEMFARIELDGRIASVEAMIQRSQNDGKMTTFYRDYSRREARRPATLALQNNE